MRKCLKKLGIGIVTMSLAISCFTGCGSKKAEDGQKGTSGKDGLSFTYTMPGKYLNWLKDLNYWDDMQSLSGVTVELVNGGDNDTYYQNVDLQISNNSLSDAVIVKQLQSSVYGAQGGFKDLAPIIKKYAPNLQKYIDENPEYKKLITAENGAIYGIGIQNPLYTNLTFYRADHFKTAGITSLPATVEEFTKVLRTLKDTFNDVQGYYPWVGRDSYLHFAENFNAIDYIDENGVVHGIYNNSLGNGTGYDIYSDGFRDMIEWYHQLYKEGLIDPEWVLGTGTEEEWQTKYLTGKGTICDDFFTRPTWFMNNGGPESDPNYDVQVMDLFKSVDGKDVKRHFTYVNQDRYLVIPESSNNEKAVMTFLNWLYSDAGQEVMHYGIDGINTTKESDGTYKWIADFAKEAVKPVGEENIGIYQDRLTFPYPVDNKSYYESLDKKVQSYCTDWFNKSAEYSNQIVYSEQQAEERSNLMAKYQIEFTSAVLNMVKGDVEINDNTWNDFLGKMESAGYSKINKIDQDAYDKMTK